MNNEFYPMLTKKDIIKLAYQKQLEKARKEREQKYLEYCEIKKERVKNQLINNHSFVLIGESLRYNVKYNHDKEVYNLYFKISLMIVLSYNQLIDFIITNRLEIN